MPQTEPTQVGIAELAELADVTPRTIRYYVAEGLLPPPGGAGQQRIYTAEHLLRLRAIKRLKEAYLPLDEIRRRLAALSLADLEQLAAAPPPPAPSSALEYLAAVLPAASSAANAAPDPVASSGSAAPAAPPPAPAAPGAPPAPAPPNSVVSEHAPGQAQPASVPGALDSARARAAIGSGVSMEEASGAAARDGDDVAASTATPWHRVTLAPGVELQYQLSGDQQRATLIARLVEEAKHLLSTLSSARQSTNQEAHKRQSAD